MTTAFQSNAFQNNAFQIDAVVAGVGFEGSTGIGAVVDIAPLEHRQEEIRRRQLQDRADRRRAIDRAWDPDAFAEPEDETLMPGDPAPDPMIALGEIMQAVRRRQGDDDAIAVLLMVM